MHAHKKIFANEWIALGEEYHQLFALSASPILNVGFLLVFHQAVVGTVKPKVIVEVKPEVGVSLDRIGLDVLSQLTTESYYAMETYDVPELVAVITDQQVWHFLC